MPRSVHLSAAALLVILAGPISGGYDQDNSAPNQKRQAMEIGAVRFAPSGSDHAPREGESAQLLVRFERIPCESDLARLGRNCSSLRYVGGYTYLCTDAERDALLKALSNIRSIVPVRPEMKISPVFSSDPELRERAARGQRLDVDIQFGPKVTSGRASLLLSRHSAALRQASLHYGGWMRARITMPELDRLLERDEVLRVEPALPGALPSNANAAYRLNIPAVRGKKAFGKPLGAGVRVAVFDLFMGRDYIHADLLNRVILADVSPDLQHFHGIAVSGIIAGDGSNNAQAKGMAPAAVLCWYTYDDDPWSKMESGCRTYGFKIVNCSWNTMPGWWIDAASGGWTWNGDTWAFGYYHARSEAADKVAGDNDLLLVFSAGNKRRYSYLGPHFHGDVMNNIDYATLHEDTHPPNPQYVSIAGAATGKNVLTVGGLTKEDLMTGYSSWGPTLDGRTKPDVVTTADITTTGLSDGYISGSGTSAATAVAGGAAALLSDCYSRIHKQTISSVMLKNLLVHTARDLGAEGPDYRYGYGIIDVELAAEVVKAAAFADDSTTGAPKKAKTAIKSAMLRGAVKNKESVAYLFEVPAGAEELRATLAWFDVPGAKLVNNIDVWAQPAGGKIVYPFVLSPKDPTALATKKRNKTDNVEHIRIADPAAGPWTFTVKGSKVPMGPQDYSLIISAGRGNSAPIVKTEGSITLVALFASTGASADDAVPVTAFTDGDPLYIHYRFSVPVNADYGAFSGSVAISTTIVDSQGNVIFRKTDESNAYPASGAEYTFTVQRLEIPSGLPAGAYSIRGGVEMHNGSHDSAELNIVVQ